MLSYFAATTPPNDPISYYFTQGVLGITVIALIITLRFIWTYFTKKIDEKDLKIELLQNARLEDNKTHTTDYREMAKNDQTVLLGNAQAQELLAGKIEAVKGRR
jgi:hypothetical protein